ncbi:MAG: hypothetical protein ACLR3R_18600 [Clostridium paraputrificum]
MKIKKKEGSIQAFIGFSLISLIIAIGILNIKVPEIKAIQRKVEDGLVASNLASATVDLKEYGTTNKIVNKDFNKAFEVFQKTLKGNLKLDNNFTPKNDSIIQSKIVVEDFRIYNVDGSNVSMFKRDKSGNVTSQTYANKLGQIKTPDGVKVVSTTVYSKISFFVKGYSNENIQVYKENTVDVVDEREG